jgi:hypothetical protein
VSEGTVPGIDPRFDPRFQRGYVPDPAAMPAARETPPVAPTAPVSTSPAPPTAPSHVTKAEADDPAAAILDLLAHAEARRLTPSGRELDDPADERAAAVDPDAARVAFTAPGDEPEPVVEVSPTRSFWIALAACVSFVVLGSALFWVQASDPATFVGSRAGIDETVRAIVSALSPALVQAGVLGVVVVLVTWAVRGRGPTEDLP